MYPAAVLPSPGQTIAGKYRLEHVLGQGGMGAVFKARNLSTGRRVAVKWMLPSAVAEEEIRARISVSYTHLGPGARRRSHSPPR